VNAGVRFDRAERDHMSGKNKIPLGWEDADIQISLDLLCDETGTCYDKLTVINGLFKGCDKGKNPRVLQVTNRHLRSRGISKVVFSGLESNEDDQSDVIRVNLAFSEHLPAVVKREKQVAATKKAVGAAAPTVKAKPAASPTIVSDPPNPFMAGFNAGNN
ncbi:MAG: hypothetical protein WA003_00315, partial [Desulfuromonadaceae bacterium]